MIQMGRIHHIETFGTVDGPGVRFVLFLQGCGLRCLYCHNVDALSLEGGQLWSSTEVVAEVLRYRNFLQGVTFSGGEPLLQPEFVAETAAALLPYGLPSAIDTAGAPDLPRARGAIDAAELILLDIKAAETTLARALTGTGNEHAFATLAYCEQTNKPVWIRHVLVPGYTLDAEQLLLLVERLQPFACIERVELLPFHQMGASKWKKQGMTYVLEGLCAPTPAEIQKILESLSLPEIWSS